MKIVMFTDSYWPRVNGVTVSVDSFSHALVRAGHEVMIVCSTYPETSDMSYYSQFGAEENTGAAGEPLVVRVPSMPSPISKEDRVAKIFKWSWVSKQIEAFAPDIVHINSEFVIAIFGFEYAKLHYLPVIYTFHTLWEDYARNYIPFLPDRLLRSTARRVLKQVMGQADRIIVPTTQIREVVNRYKIRKETYLLPTGVDPKLFSVSKDDIAAFRAKFEDKFPLLKGKRILLFAGRIAREKNISFLLNILPGIVDKHPEAVLLIAGNGPDLHEIREEAEKLQVEDHCVFSGYLTRQDLALAYGMADIFVFPSLTDTQGLVTIEAMLSGIPVVAIGEMGTLTVMGGDNGGFMVKNDPVEFTRRVFDLLEDDALYRTKVEDARAHAQSWTIDTMAVKLEQIYRSALDAWPGKRT